MSAIAQIDTARRSPIMPDTAHEWITRAEASRILGVSERSVDRWAAKQRISTQDRPGNRGKLYSRADVERLANEMGGGGGARPSTTAPDILPASELLQALTETQDKLNRAMLEIGRLQGQLEAQQRLLTAHDADRQRLTAVEEERDALKHNLAQVQDPPSWWQRLRRRWRG